MKKILALLFVLIPAIAFGQQVFIVTPVVSSSMYDSLMVYAGNDTIFPKAATVHTTSFSVGQVILSKNFPIGTKITEVIFDTVIVDNEATATDTTTAADSIQFSLFTSTAYSVGDQYGFPFAIPRFNTIYNITVMDGDDVQDSVEFVFFDSLFTPAADNAAFSVSDADAKKIMAVVPMYSVEDYALQKVIYTTFANGPIKLGPTRGGDIWVAMITKGIPTHTTYNGLKVRIVGE